MSKNLHDNELDNLFRQRFKEHETPPSDKIWKELNSNVTQKLVVQYRKKVSILKWLSAGLGTTLLLVTVLYINSLTDQKNDQSGNSLSINNENFTEDANTLPDNIKSTNIEKTNPSGLLPATTNYITHTEEDLPTSTSLLKASANNTIEEKSFSNTSGSATKPPDRSTAPTYSRIENTKGNSSSEQGSINKPSTIRQGVSEVARNTTGFANGLAENASKEHPNEAGNDNAIVDDTKTISYSNGIAANESQKESPDISGKSENTTNSGDENNSKAGYVQSTGNDRLVSVNTAKKDLQDADNKSLATAVSTMESAPKNQGNNSTPQDREATSVDKPIAKQKSKPADESANNEAQTNSESKVRNTSKEKPAKPQPDPIAQVKSSFLARFSISAYTVPAYSNRMIKEPKINDWDAKTYLNKTEKQHLSYSGGMAVELDLSNRLSVQLGACYTKSTMESGNKLELHESEPFNEDKSFYSQMTSYGTIILPFVDPDLLLKAETITQQIEMISFPIQARYTFYKKKVDLYALAGVQVNKVVNNKASILLSDDRDLLESEEIKGLKNTNYGLTIACGLEKKLGNRFSLLVQPSFNSSFTSIVEDMEIKTYPWSVGLKAGIKIHL